jgi:hypothetical protein
VLTLRTPRPPQTGGAGALPALLPPPRAPMRRQPRTESRACRATRSGRKRPATEARIPSVFRLSSVFRLRVASLCPRKQRRLGLNGERSGRGAAAVRHLREDDRRQDFRQSGFLVSTQGEASDWLTSSGRTKPARGHCLSQRARARYLGRCAYGAHDTGHLQRLFCELCARPRVTAKTTQCHAYWRSV